MSIDIAFTPPGEIYPTKLAKELRAVIPEFHSVTVDDDIYIATFDAALTPEQQTQLEDIVAAHDPTKEPDKLLIESSTLIRSAKPINNVTEWEPLAEVVSKPEYFEKNLQLVIGQILGRSFSVGVGGELRLIEDRGGLGKYINIISPEIPLPDSQGEWPVFGFYTSSPPATGVNVYELQGRRGSAADLKIKGVSLGLHRLVY